MPPYRASRQPLHTIGDPYDRGPGLDIGSVLDAVTHGASTLIQQAYLRRQAQAALERDEADRQYQRGRDAKQDQFERERFDHEREMDRAGLIEKGYGRSTVPNAAKIAGGFTAGLGQPDAATTPPHFDPARSLKASEDRLRRGRIRDAYTGAGMTRQQADAAVENPGLADDFLRKPETPKAEKAPVVDERDRAAIADRYIEAHNGDVKKALAAAAKDPNAQILFDTEGLHSSHLQAAATRFRIAQERAQRSSSSTPRTLADIQKEIDDKKKAAGGATPTPRSGDVRADTPTSRRLRAPAVAPQPAQAADSTFTDDELLAAYTAGARTDDEIRTFILRARQQ